MTVHLRDVFEASSGGLNNRVPTLNLNSLGAWINGDARLAQDEFGRVVCTYGSDPTGSGEAQCPVSTPSWSYSATGLNTGDVSMVVRREATAWASWFLGVQLGVGRENASGYTSTSYAFITASAGPVWTLVLGDTSQGDFGTWPIAFDAAIDYTLKLAFSDTALTATFNGQTYTANTPVFNGAGLRATALTLLLGRTLQVDSVEMTDGVAVLPSQAHAWAPAVLGAPKVFANTVVPLPVAYAVAASPLGGARVVARMDFTAALAGTRSLWVMDLITPGGTVRVPMGSWQATLQTGSSNYVQCVVPACGLWVDALNSATEFVISRRALLKNGELFDYEMARAPAAQLNFDRGPSRYTCTLSGYSEAFADNATPDAAYDRTLSGIRSTSSTPKLRVRCAVDWLLRPGQRAYADGVPLVVGYINYYCPSNFDAYMDVGEA